MRLRRWILALALTAGCSIGAAVAGEPERIAPGQVLRGQFVQERELQGFSAPLKTTGDFVLAPGEGLIWQAREPFAVTTVMTANGVSQRNGDVQMLDLPASKAPFLAQLYDILGGALAGNPQALERSFEIKRSDGPDGWHLALTPKAEGAGSAMPVKAIEITGRRFVDQVVVQKDGGDRDRLTFTGQSLDRGPLDAAEAELLTRVGQQ
ncbi:MAG: outer membrane lipoprotein carrier protein LolA [Rhizobiales bacterium]|nr:outer membrane lipoprotein carrier protein LolA [Hyphomicrobiales bacterium]